MGSLQSDPFHSQFLFPGISLKEELTVPILILGTFASLLFFFFVLLPQLFCSMAATFTLNFFRSGIQFGSWGSFQLPGLLNFGEFKVRFIVISPLSSLLLVLCFCLLVWRFLLTHACISVEGTWYLAAIH